MCPESPVFPTSHGDGGQLRERRRSTWRRRRPRRRHHEARSRRDDDLARVSAVMESFELHHAEDVAPPDMVASYREARRRHAVMTPARLAPGVRGRAYGPDRKIAWIRGTELGSGEPVLVPHHEAPAPGDVPAVHRRPAGLAG